MPTNDFLPWATAGGANVLAQADYATEAARNTGVVAGVGRSTLANKTWRQSSIVAAMVGQFINDFGGLDALDDGNVANLLRDFVRSLQAGKFAYVVASGSANAWVVAPTPTIAAYSSGRPLYIIAPATNTSTTVNMNVSTLGNRRIKKRDGSDPAIGDLVSGVAYATIDDGTNVRVLDSLASDVVATVSATVPVSHVATWSQSLSDTVQTDITAYTTLNSNLDDATFTGGILTVGPRSAGLWLVVLAGQHPTAGAEMLTQIMDAGTGGNAFAYNSSKTTTGAPFVTATGILRRANGDRIRGQARQISGGSVICTGRISLIRLGA